MGDIPYNPAKRAAIQNEARVGEAEGSLRAAASQYRGGSITTRALFNTAQDALADVRAALRAEIEAMA